MESNLCVFRFTKGRRKNELCGKPGVFDADGTVKCGMHTQHRLKQLHPERNVLALLRKCNKLKARGVEKTQQPKIKEAIHILIYLIER